MLAALIAELVSLLENPAVDAEIVAAAAKMIAWFKGLSVESAAAVEAGMNTAAAQATQMVNDFVAGSAADLATAQATLAQLEQHPAVVANESVAGIVANLKSQIADRAKPL